MHQIKIIDLHSIKFDRMEDTINQELEKLQNSGKQILDFKIIGDKLNHAVIFIYYKD